MAYLHVQHNLLPNRQSSVPRSEILVCSTIGSDKNILDSKNPLPHSPTPPTLPVTSNPPPPPPFPYPPARKAPQTLQPATTTAPTHMIIFHPLNPLCKDHSVAVTLVFIIGVCDGVISSRKSERQISKDRATAPMGSQIRRVRWRGRGRWPVLLWRRRTGKARARRRRGGRERSIVGKIGWSELSEEGWERIAWVCLYQSSALALMKPRGEGLRHFCICARCLF